MISEIKPEHLNHIRLNEVTLIMRTISMFINQKNSISIFEPFQALIKSIEQKFIFEEFSG